MKKILFLMSALAVTAMGIAQWHGTQLLTTGQAPEAALPTVKSAQHIAAPHKARRAAQDGLQAAFTVQGAEAQKTVWFEYFDEAPIGWTFTNSDNGYVTWQLKQSTGDHAYSAIDPKDIRSLFVEGDYRVYNRAIGYATSPAMDVPANGVLHMAVGYSQNMNDYAILSLTASADAFASADTLWSSDQETGSASWRWHQVEVDMTPYAGTSVQLRFTYGPGLKDQLFMTGGYMADFYIDGLNLTGVDEIDHVDVSTGEEINFVDVSGGEVAAWQWTFPGGTPAESTDACPTVYYKEDGNYDVTLTVTDAQGATCTVTRTDFVRVTGTAPVAKILPPATFRYDDTHLPMVAPLAPVQYADASTGFPTQWNWTFTGATPATSTLESPIVNYDFMHEQTVKLDVQNQHGASSDEIQVSAEYEGYISNILPEDYPVTYDLDGNGTFPGSNRWRITAYGEKFSKPSAPIMVYGALVFFETAEAQAIADQITNVGVHLCKSENGLPGERLDSFWWQVFELATSTSTTMRGTLFEFEPQLVNDEFFITVDGIPESNDSCNVSFAMAHLRNHDNTAYMMRDGQWRPLTGYFDAAGSQTSFYIMPLIAHSVITLLPLGTEEIEVPATAGTVEQQIFALYGYDTPQCDADWCRITSTPNELTSDTLTIAYDALPAGIESRTATFTFQDRIHATTITLRVVQKADETPALQGDVNGDGVVDGNDLNLLINILLGKVSVTDPEVKGEPNVDGQDPIDGNDLNKLINIILGK